MLDSIYTGMTGLLGFSNGLKTISNNTANMNTPGFKEATLQFSDLFYADGNLNGGNGNGQTGFGLNTGATVLNFKQGELRGTGNDLDLAIDGIGLFTLRDSNGNIHYSRAGQFEFDASGNLVDKGDGAHVMGLDSSGNLINISLSGLQTSAAQATATVKFNGNLSSTATTQSANATVIDAAGTSHALTLQFTNTTTGGSTSNIWTVNVLDGTTSVGTGSLTFVNGNIVASSSKIAISYGPSGTTAKTVTFDFSGDVTSFAAGNVTNLAMTTQDGRAAGGMTKSTFDSSGILTLTYSNGQTAQGAALAISRFDTPDAIVSIGGNRFDATNLSAWHTGRANAGSFGVIKSATIEASNVDLSQEFSDLVIMQRGYQSSSQVISTANEMLQELFTMRGK